VSYSSFYSLLIIISIIPLNSRKKVSAIHVNRLKLKRDCLVGKGTCWTTFRLMLTARATWSSCTMFNRIIVHFSDKDYNFYYRNIVVQVRFYNTLNRCFSSFNWTCDYWLVRGTRPLIIGVCQDVPIIMCLCFWHMSFFSFFF
jgi:hypothetical protein